REAPPVSQLAEVLLPEAEEGRPVELCVPAHRVVGVRMKWLPVPVVPDFLRLVSPLDVDVPRVPVGLLPAHEVPALEQEDALAGGRQGVGQRAAAGAGPDDDDVVAVHGSNLRRASGRTTLQGVCLGEPNVTAAPLALGAFAVSVASAGAPLLGLRLRKERRQS